MRDYEVYALQCFRCRSEIEIRCDSPCVCPVCGAELDIQWRPALSRLEVGQVGQIESEPITS